MESGQYNTIVDTEPNNIRGCQNSNRQHITERNLQDYTLEHMEHSNIRGGQHSSTEPITEIIQHKTYTTNPEDIMHSCDDCGLVFMNIHDLQWHVKAMVLRRTHDKEKG